MKRILSLLSLLLCVSFCFAQGKPAISFESKMHDYGKINEEDGNADCTFTFINTGDAPLVLNRVTASCGCTTPDWTKEPIAPGKKGSIKVTYAAKGRPGPFSKTITVYSNAEDSPTALTIKGEVVSKPKDIADNYPFSIGNNNLKIKQTNLNVTNVKKTEKKSQQIEIYNPTDAPVKISFENLPKEVTAIAMPATLPAKTEGKITVTVDGTAIKNYGNYDAVFRIVTDNNKNLSNNTVNVRAVIVDDFGNLSSDQKANAPVISISPSYVNFGSISDNTAFNEQVFKITNKGKTDLVIRNIDTGSKDISISSGNNTIKAGQTGEYKLKVGKNVTAPVSCLMNIVSNDPSAPSKTVRLIVKK